MVDMQPRDGTLAQTALRGGQRYSWKEYHLSHMTGSAAELMQATTTEAVVLSSLEEAEEVALELDYEAAALAMYSGAKDANDLTGGNTVEITPTGAWVAVRVWVPAQPLGANLLGLN